MVSYPEAVELYGSEIVDIDCQHRSSSTSSKFHQQPIDEVSAFQLYMSSEFLKATLNMGAFCCTEGYFVICDEKYMLPGEGVLFLTEYARLHLSECTLDSPINLFAVVRVTWMFSICSAPIPNIKSCHPLIPIRRI